MTPTWLIVTQIICGGIIGAVVGGLLAHILANRRDSANDRRSRERDRLDRINNFRGELGRWRCQFYRESDLYGYYKQVTPDISYECEKIMSDIGQIPAMAHDLWQLYSFKLAEVETPNREDGRKKVIDHIEDMILKLRTIS